MKICIIYVFPTINPKLYEPMARRFTNAYTEHPPGETDHELYICANGGKATERQERLFDPLVPKFIQHNNVGRDIGAYVMAARSIPSDFMVCLGTPVRPRMAGWLDRLVMACENNGPGIYSPWGSHTPEVHLRTTAFSITPQLLASYPYEIDDSRRYSFEHGRDSITLWCLRQGFQAMQVTNKGVFEKKDWHFVPVEESSLLDQHYDKL